MVDGVIELRVLGVVLDLILSFESYFMPIAASAFIRLGIMRKALCLFGDPVFVLRCF